MSYKLELQQEAIAEMQKAYEWYENQKTGLGNELIIEIESCLATLGEHPERYGYIRESNIYRRIRISRFPYMIVYEIEGDIVIINGVIHFKQDKKF